MISKRYEEASASVGALILLGINAESPLVGDTTMEINANFIILALFALGLLVDIVAV